MEIIEKRLPTPKAKLTKKDTKDFLIHSKSPSLTLRAQWLWLAEDVNSDHGPGYYTITGYWRPTTVNRNEWYGVKCHIGAA